MLQLYFQRSFHPIFFSCPCPNSHSCKGLEEFKHNYTIQTLLINLILMILS
jgi:hypothetical protein